MTIAPVECRMCNSVGCPYCRGALPTFRSVLAHRQTFQDARGIQQSSPIRPALSDCAPTQSESPGEVSGRSNDPEVDLNSVVHAPNLEHGDAESLTENRSENRRPHDMG